MELIFKFKDSIGNTSIENIFRPYYDWFCKTHSDIKTSIVDVTYMGPTYQGSNNSGYFLTITNPKNNKYIVVSYWDNVYDLLIPELGWNYENCVDIITSCGIYNLNRELKYSPFSYLNYEKNFEVISENNFIPFENKQKNDLVFRGRLYGYRKLLNLRYPKNILEDTIPQIDYLNEISNNKINLSLNGAAEICHRDMEILSTSSVLLRPKLHVKFHNELIPWVHYLPFDFDENNSVETQWEIIVKIFNENQNNLSEISKNGFEWYKKNGTINSNIELLKKIINIKKLF